MLHRQRGHQCLCGSALNGSFLSCQTFLLSGSKKKKKILLSENSSPKIFVISTAPTKVEKRSLHLGGEDEFYEVMNFP